MEARINAYGYRANNKSTIVHTESVNGIFCLPEVWVTAGIEGCATFCLSAAVLFVGLVTIFRTIFAIVSTITIVYYCLREGWCVCVGVC